MINNRLVNVSLIISGILTLILVLFPDLDISISNIFYNSKFGFQYKKQPVVQFFFRVIPILTVLFIAICCAYILYIILKYKSVKRIINFWAFFLLITAIIGPGLTVNSILKENFGRARPVQIVEFGGEKEFSRALTISDQCNTNCSFASGHAAMGFYFTAIAYVAGYLYFVRIYLAALVFGSFIGLSRIIMGGHFASDVIASGFIVLFLNHIIYFLWKNKVLKCKKLQ